MIRTLRIGFRTLHIGAMGLLLGGLAFDISPERLEVSFWVTVGSGVALVLVESGARWLWFHQLSGVMTLTKVALFVAVPLAWDFRLPILLAVVVIGSVGSHMPGRYRHFSVIYGQVIRDKSDFVEKEKGT
jgi:hypothetical protein